MVKLILIVAVIILLICVVKYFTGKNKPAEQRSALEKIICSIMVKNRQQMNELADSVRTVDISREEGIQKCKDAIKQLDLDYKEEMISTLNRRDELKENLPKLKSKPGIYEGKARTAKKKMEEAKEAGKPDSLVKTLEDNVYMYLEYKDNATKRVKRTEQSIEELEVAIETSKAVYEGRKATLDDMLAEFESMTTAISAAKFNNSINLINSLRKETATKLRQQRNEVEAQNMINEGESQTTGSSVDRSRYEAEFNNL